MFSKGELMSVIKMSGNYCTILWTIEWPQIQIQYHGSHDCLPDMMGIETGAVAR